MAAKKSRTRPATVATLAKLISRTAGSADEKFAALAEDISDIKRTMATKDDIASLSEQATSIERELKSIRRDLDDLRRQFENVSGFRKEIDHGLERIAAIDCAALPAHSLARNWCDGIRAPFQCR
jgi:chromosome segregation ATPase